MGWLDKILFPLYDAVSWIMRVFYELFKPVFGANSGWTWSLSIVGLVIIIRIILIPLFVKQIRASRNMLVIQPKIKELQKKYGHDRERLGREMMQLYKESGTNPFSSCLPILLQSPVFYALFRVLDGAAQGKVRGNGLNAQLVDSLRHASIFGAHISDKFVGAQSWQVRVVTLVMIVLMVATTFTTQRQLMRKNMAKEALSGQYAQQQKLLLYVLPLVFLIGGVNFPLGVLIYWLVSNLWTTGQQFYVIRRNPVPGSEAHDALLARRAAKQVRRGTAPALTGGPTANGSEDSVGDAESAAQARRSQPQRLSRSQRRPSGTRSAASSTVRQQARPTRGRSATSAPTGTAGGPKKSTNKS